MTTRRVTFLLFDGFAATDAIGPADVFATANQQAERYAYALRYVGGDGCVRASNGLAFATEPLATVGTSGIDMLLVPGADEEPLLAAMQDAALLAWVAEAASLVPRLCSVCSGAFLLQACGLLDGRRATTHWRGLDRLAAGADTQVERDALFVEDRGIWTSAGVTAGIDMALAIVERDLGRPIALAVAREMVLFLVRPGSQAQFSAPLDLQQRAASGDLRALPAWLEARLATRVTVAQMAGAMAMSERTFHRRCVATLGATPLALLHRLRLERARALLEDGATPLKTVAAQSGLGDIANLRRVFIDAYGVAPARYRAMFSRRG